MENMFIENGSKDLDTLLEKVYQECGHDFRDYKRGTVTRRLERRLQATGTRTYLEYMQFLNAHPEEYQRLIDYVTITVSGFFRGSVTFQQVARLVLPELVAYKRDRGEQRLRVWSTACAQGEEPYSIAMMLAEFMGNQPEDFDISIYATDINRQALTRAKTGIYSLKDVENIPPSILESYFTSRDNNYMVNNDIRRMVAFSHFDLISTTASPFADMDLVFCCNFLIYLQRHRQEKVINMLYNSINAPGYLVLGEVETLNGSSCEKLDCIDNQAKIYRKN